MFGSAKKQPDPSEFMLRFDHAAERLLVIAWAIIGDRHWAEDVVQEVAVVAWRKYDQFDPNTDFNAWTAQITRNIARRRRDHERRRQGADLDHVDFTLAARPEEGTTDPSPAAPLFGLELDDTMTSALGQLSEVARSCFMLRSVLDFSYKEIADVLEIPAGTAMSHVHRARQQLALALVDHDGKTVPSGEG
jgi:RNA polymerase sigma-70 factor (ECF subfamily)